jgi:hypothetical protein
MRQFMMQSVGIVGGVESLAELIFNCTMLTFMGSRGLLNETKLLNLVENVLEITQKRDVIELNVHNVS